MLAALYAARKVGRGDRSCILRMWMRKTARCDVEDRANRRRRSSRCGIAQQCAVVRCVLRRNCWVPRHRQSILPRATLSPVRDEISDTLPRGPTAPIRFHRRISTKWTCKMTRATTLCTRECMRFVTSTSSANILFRKLIAYKYSDVEWMRMCACVRACVCVRACACVRACMCACILFCIDVSNVSFIRMFKSPASRDVSRLLLYVKHNNSLRCCCQWK